MTFAIPAVEPADSLEVRWIVRGPLETAMREWFARFPAAVETRTDAYLLQPRLAGLSVKLRDGARMDVKSYLGSPGVIDLPWRCRGRLESWRKWSFGYRPADPGDVVPAGWVIVRKRRHRSRFPLGAGGCVVELTQACVSGEAWWSLAFEATGPAGVLRGALDHAAGLLFAQSLPAEVELGLDRSRSYLDWLTEAGRDDDSAAGAGGALRSLKAMPSRTSSSTMPPRM